MTDQNHDLRKIAAELQKRRTECVSKADASMVEHYSIGNELLIIAGQILGKDPESLALGSWKCPDEISDFDHKRAKRDPSWAEYFEEMKARYKEASDKNISGVCVYDDEEDPCHDFCLFCGDPDERK